MNLLYEWQPLFRIRYSYQEEIESWTNLVDSISSKEEDDKDSLKVY